MANSEHDLLNRRLAEGEAVLDVQANRIANECKEVASTPSANVVSFELAQWSSEFNDSFRPSGRSCKSLPAGVYRFNADERGIFIQRIRVITDSLIDLDDSASNRVIAGIRTFWKSKGEYTKRGIVYKRGILLWGPAGSGKTATLAMLTRDLIGADGLVVICENPGLTSTGLSLLRRIEAERPLIVVMEDIDELLARHGEHEILALLDGENQINNVVNIATTNYPERLGARIVNRPSRFDERILIDMPNERARLKYLRVITNAESITESTLQQWVRDTQGFSVAHMRELVVAVFCLKQDYESVLERLGKMRLQPRARDEFQRISSGFESPNAPMRGFAASRQ